MVRNVQYLLRLVVLAMAVVGLAACGASTPSPAPANTPAAPVTAPAPTIAPPAGATSAPVPQVTPTTAAAAPGIVQKPIVVGLTEPIDGILFYAGITSLQFQAALFTDLTYRDGDLKVQLGAAEEAPSIAKGTWKLNSDGSMDTTWKLRKDAKWTDGTPLTADDYIFGQQAMINPKVPNPAKGIANQIQTMTAPDPYTLVVHWKGFYPFADERLGAPALPRQILKTLFESDVEKFVNSKYWTTDFIGNGPYKIKSWVPQSQIEVVANDDYFLGKPKIPSVVFKLIPDTNTLYTNILAGQVDVSLPRGISVDQAIALNKDKSADWNVMFTPSFSWYNIEFAVEKIAYFKDVKVRQALLHAINRQQIVDTLFGGKGIVANLYIPPQHPLINADSDKFIHKYPYDPAKATALLTEAGWTKGSDGVLANKSGEKMSFVFTTGSGQADFENIQAVVAENWKAIGVQTTVENRPSRGADYNDWLFQRMWKGVYLLQRGSRPDRLPDIWATTDIPRKENGFSGSNLSVWSNPQGDALIKQIITEPDLAKRQALNNQFIDLWTTELPHLPILIAPDIAVVKQGLSGVKPDGSNNPDTYNIQQWMWTK